MTTQSAIVAQPVSPAQGQTVSSPPPNKHWNGYRFRAHFAKSDHPLIIPKGIVLFLHTPNQTPLLETWKGLLRDQTLSNDHKFVRSMKIILELFNRELLPLGRNINTLDTEFLCYGIFPKNDGFSVCGKENRLRIRTWHGDIATSMSRLCNMMVVHGLSRFRLQPNQRMTIRGLPLKEISDIVENADKTSEFFVKSLSKLMPSGCSMGISPLTVCYDADQLTDKPALTVYCQQGATFTLTHLNQKTPARDSKPHQRLKSVKLESKRSYGDDEKTTKGKQ